MKVFLISNMYPSKEHPSFGVFVENFVTNLKNEYGLSFILAVIKGKRSSLVKKVLAYMYHYTEIVLRGLTSNYSLLYLHYISHSAAPVLLVKLLTGKKLVINAHGSDVISDNNILKINSYFIKKLVHAADCIVVPSKYYKEVMMKKYNVTDHKIFISPSGGVNTSLFSPTQNVRTSKELVIGYVSRIEDGKGWDVFLDAVFILKKIINVKAVIVGDGLDKDKLVSEIKRKNMEDLVEVYGLLPQRDLPKIYNRLDVFIFPTVRLAESLGLVGLESMACGVPVIGSDIGGPSEYIENAKNGYTFIPGNAEDLALKIQLFDGLSLQDVLAMKKNSIRTANNFQDKLVVKKIYTKLANLLSED